MTGRLIAQGVELSLKERIPILFNYSRADVKQPQKRKRNFSRSATLPGTQANMAFFSSTYQLSLSTVGGTSIAGFDYDPTIRVPAKYYDEGGALVFNGLLRLTNVSIENGDYSFEIELYSNFVELYMALGDMKLSELGWSEYNHPLTRTIVRRSWGVSIVQNGVSVPNFTAGNPDGFGYLYGLVDYGYTRPAPTTFSIGDIFPMVYEREVLLKCLNVAGITHSGNFVDSTLFKKHLIGYGGGDKNFLSPTEVANRRTAFTGNLSTAITRPATTVYEEGGEYFAIFNLNTVIRIIRNDVLTPTVTNDVYDQYSESDGVVTVERAGSYKLALSQTINSSLNTGSMTYESGSSSFTYFLKKNGATIASPGIPSYAGGFPNLAVSIDQELSCEAGDALTVDLFITSQLVYKLPGSLSTLENITLTLTDSADLSFDLTSTQTTLNDGDTVELARFLPDMKAVDAVTGIITKWNLMIEDPDIDNVCRVEPLADFYKPTDEFDDWTQLLDHSQKVNIRPSASVEGKVYKFKFAEDNDYDNKRYRDRFGIGYGDYNYEVESTWVKGDREYVLPFAQTIPTDELGLNFVVPRIVSFDEQTGTKKPFKGKPRMYIWNGLKSIAWRLTDVNGAVFDDLTTYPSVHHFDDWTNPTFDANWGLPLELQYVTNVITNRNYFTAYHRDFILDLTGKDSKLLEAFFKLNSSMIENMDFGKLKMINGVLFRLNEIRDFDNVNATTTECELLKIVAAKKPKEFLTLSIVKPAKHDPPLIQSPHGLASVAASTGLISGGRNDVLATGSKIIG